MRDFVSGAYTQAGNLAQRPMPNIAPAAEMPAAPWCDSVLGSQPRALPVADLYARVKAGVKAKDEFEASQAFERRSNESLAAIVKAMTPTNGTEHAVLIVPFPSAPYNADKLEFTLRASAQDALLTHEAFVGTDYKTYPYLFVPISLTSRAGGSYVGSNAFGVTRQVQVTNAMQYGVALADQTRLRGWGREKKQMTLWASPVRAASLKGKLGIMLVGNLVAPGALEGRRSYEATIDNPYEDRVQKRYVVMTAPCAGVVNVETRELLQTIR